MIKFFTHIVIFAIIMLVEIPMWVWFLAFFIEAAYLFSMINVKEDHEFKNLN